MDAQWTIASTRHIKTRNWKSSCSRCGPNSGSSEILVDHGIVCFQMQCVRKVQGGRQGPRNAQGNHKGRWRDVWGRAILEKRSAVSQFKTLDHLLEKDENLKQRYKKTIDVAVQKGFVRILDRAELEDTKSDLQWYVPRLLVLNPNKNGQSETSMQRCLKDRRGFT